MLATIKLINSDIVTAFALKTVGTKVIDAKKFNEVAIDAISRFDFAVQRVPGQGFIQCPDAMPFISAGVGRRTKSSLDYHALTYRGEVTLFLKRELAATVEGCALVVYTREAYLADPDVLKDEDKAKRIKESDCTHVLVAILGFAGPKAPLNPDRLMHNLAGGNNEALAWTADEIRAKAKETLDYWREWCVVAD